MKNLRLILPLIGIFSLITGCENHNNTNIADTENITTDLQKSEICNDNKGTLTNRAEGGDITVCAFNDNSFCFLEDLESGLCKKGLIFFDDTNEINDEIDNIETLNTNESKNLEASECNLMEQDIVCGKDGNTYQNRCYLDKAGVEEETELAQIEDGVCIFG